MFQTDPRGVEARPAVRPPRSRGPFQTDPRGVEAAVAGQEYRHERGCERTLVGLQQEASNP